MKALGRGSIASYLEIALNVVRVLLWAALGLVVVVLVMSTLIEIGVLDREELARQSQIVVDIDRTVGWPMLIASFVAALIAISGGLIIVGRLKAVYATFRAGEYFKKENATNLRVIWLTMIGVELSRYAIQATAGALFLASGAKTELFLSVNLMSWTAILVLIAVSEIFREGARLREEQELTI